MHCFILFIYLFFFLFLQEIGIDAKSMRVAYHKDVQGFFLFEKESRSLKNEGFYKGGKVTILY